MSKILANDVIEIIQDCINSEGVVVEVDRETSAKTLLEWDSLVQLMIITELDERLGEKVSGIMALAEATSVNGILTLLKENGLCEEECGAGKG